MTHRSAHAELNDWLNRHGYRHALESRERTPHPYAMTPQQAHAHMGHEHTYETCSYPSHARIDQAHPYVPSSRMAHAKVIRQKPTGRLVFAAHERDHHITTAGRRALKRSQFALPPGPEEKRRGIRGRLPIDKIERAQNALNRASMMRNQGHITARELEKARRAVHRAWPSIGRDGS
jgi:hypothetical protein